MDNYLSKDSKTKIKGLAYYQIVGGILGISLTIWLIATTITVTGLHILIFLLAFGLYSFSFYSGRELLKGDIKRGLKFSTINQALQTIGFAMFGYAFKFVSGLLLSIGVDMIDDFKFIFNFSLPSFDFSINTDNTDLNVTVNLVAIFFILFIEKLNDRVESDRQRFENSQQIIVENSLTTPSESV